MNNLQRRGTGGGIREEETERKRGEKYEGGEKEGKLGNLLMVLIRSKH